MKSKYKNKYMCRERNWEESRVESIKKKRNTRYYINLQYYMKTHNESEKQRKENHTSKRGLPKISQNTN
jgi:hypothetical protein